MKNNPFILSFKDFYKNPLIILVSLLLLIINKLYANYIYPKIPDVFSNIQILNKVLTIHDVISLLIMSFFFSVIIAMSKSAIKGKSKLSDFSSGLKYLIQNFSILFLIYIILFRGINYISIYSALFMGGHLTFTLKIAQILFYLIYVFFLLAILIFFTYSSFYLVANNLSLINSIKSSSIFVKNNYILTLSIFIALFIISQIINYISNINLILSQIIYSAIIVPYLSLLLTRLIIK